MASINTLVVVMAVAWRQTSPRWLQYAHSQTNKQKLHNYIGNNNNNGLASVFLCVKTAHNDIFFITPTLS